MTTSTEVQQRCHQFPRYSTQRSPQVESGLSLQCSIIQYAILTNCGAHYDITEACLEDGIWKSIRDSLKDIKDLEKLSRKLVLKRFTPRDVAVLLDSLHKSVELREVGVIITCNETNTFRNTCNVSVGELPLETLINFIETRITAEEAMGLDSVGSTSTALSALTRARACM